MGQRPSARLTTELTNTLSSYFLLSWYRQKGKKTMLPSTVTHRTARRFIATFAVRSQSSLSNSHLTRSKQTLEVCPQHARLQYRSLSSPATSDEKNNSFFSSPTGWWRGRQEEKEAQKYRDHLEAMSNKPVWTIGDFEETLKEQLNQSWFTKALAESKELKLAEELKESVVGILSVVGKDATAQDLEATMTRLEKLKAASAAGTTVDQINLVLQQFETMSLVHRVIRNRKEQGKPIPQSMEAVQAIVQAEGPKLLSKKQKSRLMKQQKTQMMKGMRRR